MTGEYPARRDFFSLWPLNKHFVNSLMLPSPSLSPLLVGLVLRQISAYTGLALHEMPKGYELLKFSDSSSYVIPLILFSDKRFSKLRVIFCKIRTSARHGTSSIWLIFGM